MTCQSLERLKKFLWLKRMHFIVSLFPSFGIHLQREDLWSRRRAMDISELQYFKLQERENLSSIIIVRN